MKDDSPAQANEKEKSENPADDNDHICKLIPFTHPQLSAFRESRLPQYHT